KYNFTSWLNAEIKYQYERLLTHGKKLSKEQSYYVRNLINSFASVDASGNVTMLDNIPLGGILDLSNSELNSNSIRGQLNISRKWSAHSINAIAGVEAREVTTETNS